MRGGAGGPVDAQGVPVVRPYTPVSTNAMLGRFELMVKVYPEGKMSQHLEHMEVGHTVDFKHIDKNVKMQYPFNKPEVGMLVGGTGIAPMIQALHAVLGTRGDSTKVSLLYGSRSTSDVLCKGTLDEWSDANPDRLSVTHVLSHEAEGSPWSGARGFISKELVQAKMPAPSSDCVIFVCGPPPMYDALCGPRDSIELTGLLFELGYKPEQVYKF